MVKKCIYIPVLLFLFVTLQINNNGYYINQSSLHKIFKCEDNKDKTLRDSFHNKLLNWESHENLSFIKQSNSDDEESYLIGLFYPLNQIIKDKIRFIKNNFRIDLNLTYNPRAPPYFQSYS